ncbi:MAG: SDR family oxidoreductase [Pseudomonadota bacterium]
MGRLDGKVCLVTAAGQGIGHASALAMAEEGAKVFATDISDSNFDALKAGGCETFLLDVRSKEQISGLVDTVGAPDVVFNCAGYVATGTILDCDEDDWHLSLDINLTGMYRITKALLPGMLAKGGGTFINMASVVSSVIAAPNRFVYGTTKAGVIGLTKALAADFVTQGIRAHAICPGTVGTPSLEGRLEAMGDYDTARSSLVARQPIGRFGRPEEIASLAVYLGSDETSFTTGTIHVIDGGWSNV